MLTVEISGSGGNADNEAIIQILQNTIAMLTDRVAILEDIIISNDIRAATRITDSAGNVLITNTGESLILSQI